MSYVLENQRRMMLLTNHSAYHNYEYKCYADNPSTIYTKLVQLAGRYCEYYASDIVNDILNICDSIERRAPYDRVLRFCEIGVRCAEVHFDLADITEDSSIIQTWRVRYVPGRGKVYLWRVDEHGRFPLFNHVTDAAEWLDKNGVVHTVDQYEEEYENLIASGDLAPYDREFKYWLLDQTKGMTVTKCLATLSYPVNNTAARTICLSETTACNPTSGF